MKNKAQDARREHNRRKLIILSQEEHEEKQNFGYPKTFKRGSQVLTSHRQTRIKEKSKELIETEDPQS